MENKVTEKQVAQINEKTKAKLVAQLSKEGNEIFEIIKHNPEKFVSPKTDLRFVKINDLENLTQLAEILVVEKYGSKNWESYQDKLDAIEWRKALEWEFRDNLVENQLKLHISGEEFEKVQKQLQLEYQQKLHDLAQTKHAIADELSQKGSEAFEKHNIALQNLDNGKDK